MDLGRTGEIAKTGAKPKLPTTIPNLNVANLSPVFLLTLMMPLCADDIFIFPQCLPITFYA